MEFTSFIQEEERLCSFWALRVSCSVKVMSGKKVTFSG